MTRPFAVLTPKPGQDWKVAVQGMLEAGEITESLHFDSNYFLFILSQP